jgi:hypothetical protein
MREWKLWQICLLATCLVPSLALAQDDGKKPGPDGYPRQITGKELAAHFEGTWSVNGATSKGTPITFFSNADGTVRIRGHVTSRTPDGFGTREVKTDKNRVCLNFTTTSWRGATGCYRLIETEPKAYSLRAGSYRIEYRR